MPECVCPCIIKVNFQLVSIVYNRAIETMDTQQIDETRYPYRTKWAKRLRETIDSGDTSRVARLLKLILTRVNIATPDVFLLFEMALQLTSEEFMRKVLYVDGNPFEYYGIWIEESLLQEDEETDLTLFTAFATKLGLARTLWTTPYHSMIPFHFLCSHLIDQHFDRFPMHLIPDELVNELLITKDSDGSVPLHIHPDDSYFRYNGELVELRYSKLINYLSKFPNYKPSLLVQNEEGDTPLHLSIHVMDSKDINLLLDTDECKSTMMLKNKYEDTAYDILYNYTQYSDPINRTEEDNALRLRFDQIRDSLVYAKPAKRVAMLKE